MHILGFAVRSTTQLFKQGGRESEYLENKDQKLFNYVKQKEK